MKSVIFLIVALVFIIVAAFYLARKETRDERDKEHEAERKANSTINSILKTVMPGIFTDAEIKYGNGTGIVKIAFATAEALKIIPEELKQYINFTDLVKILEELLTFTKDLWKQNPKLLRIEQDKLE